MQLPLAEARRHPCWAHYQDMWSRCLKGFVKSLNQQPELVFAPELLPARVEFGGKEHLLNYAREVDGEETSDRWSEALELVQFIDDLAAQLNPADTENHQNF